MQWMFWMNGLGLIVRGRQEVGFPSTPSHGALGPIYHSDYGIWDPGCQCFLA